MYVVNTPVAENGRRLVKIREFYGRVTAHGVAPEVPEASHETIERMMKEKDLFVAAREGTVKTLPKDESQIVRPEPGDNEDSEEEANTSP